MVGSNGQWGSILQSANDVKVGHTRLYHEHISTFLCIQCGLDECLTSVGRILLVGLFVTKARVRVKGITEWSVVGGSVFSSVREDGDIGETFRVKRIANGLDSSILHITRSHNIATSSCLTHGLFTKLVNSNIIQNNSIFHHTIMSLVRIRIQRNICADNCFRVLLLNHADGPVDNSLGIVRLACKIGLELISHFWEKDKCLNSQFQCLANFIHHALGAMALASRH
mmetsp:Transcript_10432/g.16916  ORF Transcript_10432/g.16916 Transcript_10432/m.16916 type:complete len:226 (+) Transcript_10432:200-877(+)